MAAKIKKGDKVIVLTGRDKGRTGEVLAVHAVEGRALVQGVHMVKRHQRQTAQQEGRIISTRRSTRPKVTRKGGKEGRPKAGGEPKVKKPRERSDYVARLKTRFEEVIRPELSTKFGYTTRFQVPQITKVVLNMGIGEGVADRKKVDNAAADLTLIAGQKAVITKARKAIATYKLRDFQAMGCKVTLPKARLYDFLV